MTDREWDRALHIQTMGRENETGVKYMPYEPTPYSVLLRLAESGFILPSDHLLDYGCGKGRAALFLASRIGCRSFSAAAPTSAPRTRPSWMARANARTWNCSVATNVLSKSNKKALYRDKSS